MLRPGEVETPIYPNETHSFGASSPRVSFLDDSDFTLFLNNKEAFKPHCNKDQGVGRQRISSQGQVLPVP